MIANIVKIVKNAICVIYVLYAKNAIDVKRAKIVKVLEYVKVLLIAKADV